MSNNVLGFTAPLCAAQSASNNGFVKSITSTTPSPTSLATPPSTNTQPCNLRMAFTSIGGVLTPPPMTTTSDDMSVVIRQIYVQVLGNAHLMDSERAELASAESEFKMFKDVREFVRAIGLSSAYRERFFEGVSQYRFVELAFKHLLGRAPEDKEEYAQVMNVYHTKGYTACINLFMDSIEYDENFGPSIIPYGIYKGCYSSNELFNRSVAIRLTNCSSDKGRQAMLQYCVPAGESPSWLTISKALPVGTERGTGFQIGSYSQSTQTNDKAEKRIGTKIPGGVVFYSG